MKRADFFLKLVSWYYKIAFFGRCKYYTRCELYQKDGLYCDKQKGFVSDTYECGKKRELRRLHGG